MYGEEDLVKAHKGQAEILVNIIVFAFIIILSRLVYLQIYKGQELYQYSLENQLRREIVKAPRGMIFSRNNQLIVHNIPRFDVVVIPQDIRKKKDTLTKLAKILNMPLKKIEKIMRKSGTQASYRPITISKNISRKQVAIIETENRKMPGIRVTTFISREYSDKMIGAHLLGYISEISRKQLPRYRRKHSKYKLGDYVGHAGLEEELDSTLRGNDGYEFMQVDALGRMKRRFSGEGILKEVKNKPATPGNNIRISIDRDLQVSGYNALDGKVGGAVAVDIKSGEILAMVSSPSFDPSQFSRGLTKDYWKSLVDDERNPLRDRTVQEHYAPGSTFKVITAIAALEEGIVNEHTRVHCSGHWRLGTRKYHCWKKYGHGKVDLVKSLRESCDVYYYRIAAQLDIDVLAKYAKALGLGSKTGIGLPRETSGLIPTKEWKRKRNKQAWAKGETLSCAIGQSFVLTTPLQLVMAYAAIASGGKLQRPYLVKEVFSNSGDVLRRGQADLVEEVHISERTLKLVKKGLFEVVNHRKGTAWWQKGRGIHMAGKTGTSQVISFAADDLFTKCEERKYKLRHHGIFAAYAPAHDPRIAVAVVVEHGCHGSSAAAPVARDIITTYMKKYMPEEYKRLAAIDRRNYLKEMRKRKKEKDSEGDT